MAKDQNSFAKRQREMNKKRKADEKKERRAKRKQEAVELLDSGKSSSSLSPEERSVLDLFRDDLMAPGKILCLSKPDLNAFEVPLSQLTNDGLLVAESTEGSYSLTEAGFAIMNDGQ